MAQKQVAKAAMKFYLATQEALPRNIAEHFRLEVDSKYAYVFSKGLTPAKVLESVDENFFRTHGLGESWKKMYRFPWDGERWHLFDETKFVALDFGWRFEGDPLENVECGMSEDDEATSERSKKEPERQEFIRKIMD
ncbi:MAG: hypothetical protein V1656_01350 [Candidatus Jorgensenbacteria bacterium]